MHDDFDESQMFSPEAIVGSDIIPAIKPLDTPNAPIASDNPLSAYFRMPGLHVKLPTKGVFFSPNDYCPTMGEDLPIYPMKGADELLLKSPDALMSGHALVRLLQSCVPSIKNPRQISTPDLDVLLLAIRAATYGDIMAVEVACPTCGDESEMNCSLGHVLSTMKTIPSEISVRVSDNMVVYVRPYSLEVATKVATATFAQVRKAQGAEGLDDAAKAEVLNEVYDAMTQISLRALTSSIVKIVVPNHEVTDVKFIGEFVANTDSLSLDLIESRIKEINEMGIDKTLDVTCPSCSHQWKTAIEFDPSSFFEKGS